MLEVHFLAGVSNSVTVHILTPARVWGFSVRTGSWLSQHRPLSCDSVQIARVGFKCMQICGIFPSSLFSMSPSQRQLGICSDDKFPFASRKNDSELLIKSTSWTCKENSGFFIRPLPSCMVMTLSQINMRLTSDLYVHTQVCTHHTCS